MWLNAADYREHRHLALLDIELDNDLIVDLMGALIRE
jgi:hypothetical protein